MSATLVLGLAAIGGAIGLGCAAAMSGAKIAKADRGLTSIEDFYSRGLGVKSSPPLTAPLSAPMLGLRAIAARLSPSNVLIRVQRHLDIAGNPGRWTAERVLAFKGLGLVCAGIAGLLIGLRSTGLTVLLLPVLAAAVGFFLPDVLLYNTGLKRQLKVQRALPDALDMMTVCVEAGLGFDASMSQVARNTEGALAAEYARVLQEMQFGKSRVQALRSMAERTTVAELRIFVSALVQASDLGIPIAAVLREQAHEMRTRRRQRGEEQAQKVTVKILLPLIFCLFPALMIVVIGPGALNIANMF